jgi:hypothetical protein
MLVRVSLEVELARHDWGRLRAAGNASGLPDAFRALASAPDAQAADAAYWRIDNTVLVQGSLHESAEAAASVGVVALVHATPPGRARLLELLGQIAAGEAAPSEPAAGNTGLAARCQHEVARGFPVYVAFLGSTDEPDELASCIDLLGLAARADAALSSQARFHLERLLSRGIPAGLEKLTRGWLEELS